MLLCCNLSPPAEQKLMTLGGFADTELIESKITKNMWTPLFEICCWEVTSGNGAKTVERFMLVQVVCLGNT